MTVVDKDLNRNRRVARCFGARAGEYEDHAGLQRQIASELATLLPSREAPSVLEVGCGTGFLTAHLLDAYRQGDFLITDIAPEMVAECRERQGSSPVQKMRFAEMDGEAPDAAGPFDVIALSMTLQWFADPLTGLARLGGLLNPGGQIVYATLGPDSFPEWRAALAVENVPDGTITMPGAAGHRNREKRVRPTIQADTTFSPGCAP